MSTTHLDRQTKIAAKTGISQSSVQRLLSEEQSATLDLLEQLSKAFNLKPQHLLLEPDEISLLSAFNNLSDDDKQTILGFMNMRLQTSLRPPIAASANRPKHRTPQ